MFENSRFQRWQRRREALNFAHLACVIPTHLHLLVVWWWAGQLTFLWNGYVVCCLTHREALSWSIFSGERSLKTLRAAQMCRMLISVLRCKDRAMFFFPHRVALCFEEWWSQTVSGDNPLTQTHSTWLVPLTKEERNWVTMFINRPLSSAFLGARPWFILKEKQIVQKVQTLPWKNPVQCGFRHLPSRKRVSRSPSPALACPGSWEVCWGSSQGLLRILEMRSGFQGEPLCSWAF